MFCAQESAELVFVRRWTRELPRELAADWRESVYLNLIVHTRFTLTVAICSYAGLKDRSRPGPRTFVKVVKPVYAAPSVARVDLKTNKAAATQLSWPDVYFAVRCGVAAQRLDVRLLADACALCAAATRRCMTTWTHLRAPSSLTPTTAWWWSCARGGACIRRVCAWSVTSLH